MGFFDPTPEKPFAVRPVEFYFDDPAVVKMVRGAIAGDSQAVRSAIASGANPNSVGHVQPGSPYGFLPLHYLIGVGSGTGIQLLMGQGADPEFRAPEMGSPLLFAITLNRPAILALLLDGKPVARLAEKTKQQLLFEAARRNSPGSLTLLLQQGVPIDVRDDAGYTLMLRSVEMEELDLTIWLLDHGASAKVVTANGLTATYSIDFEMRQLTPLDGSKEHLLRKIMQMLIERGGRFPPMSPEQVRASQR
jgi:ankyrin repeat protein